MTMYEAKVGDNLDGYGKLKIVTEKAIMVEGYGWIPLSIIVEVTHTNGKNRWAFNGELPYWFLQQNPNWKPKKNYGF